jgi:bisphosphoglycerate-independent phosphoglycerate mutase (AlkP superfamily)
MIDYQSLILLIPTIILTNAYIRYHTFKLGVENQLNMLNMRLNLIEKRLNEVENHTHNIYERFFNFKENRQWDEIESDYSNFSSEESNNDLDDVD